MLVKWISTLKSQWSCEWEWLKHTTEQLIQGVLQNLDELIPSQDEIDIMHHLQNMDTATALKALVPNEFNEFLLQQSQKLQPIEIEATAQLFRVELWANHYFLEVSQLPLNFWIENDSQDIESKFWKIITNLVTIFVYNHQLYVFYS